MTPVKTTLLVNGTTSGATGIALVAFAKPIATLFGLSATAVFVATGAFLVLFATYVLYAAFQNPIKTKQVKLISALDISWVIASIVVVIAAYSSITTLGVIIILAVAAWVALMAILQSKGIRQGLGNSAFA